MLHHSSSIGEIVINLHSFANEALHEVCQATILNLNPTYCLNCQVTVRLVLPTFKQQQHEQHGRREDDVSDPFTLSESVSVPSLACCHMTTVSKIINIVY